MDKEVETDAIKTARIMGSPLIHVCSMLQDRMARKQLTEDKVSFNFKDIVFVVSAKSENVPESWDDFIKRVTNE